MVLWFFLAVVNSVPAQTVVNVAALAAVIWLPTFVAVEWWWCRPQAKRELSNGYTTYTRLSLAFKQPKRLVVWQLDPRTGQVLAEPGQTPVTRRWWRRAQSAAHDS